MKQKVSRKHMGKFINFALVEEAYTICIIDVEMDAPAHYSRGRETDRARLRETEREAERNKYRDTHTRTEKERERETERHFSLMKLMLAEMEVGKKASQLKVGSMQRVVPKIIKGGLMKIMPA